MLHPARIVGRDHDQDARRMRRLQKGPQTDECANEHDLAIEPAILLRTSWTCPAALSSSWHYSPETALRGGTPKGLQPSALLASVTQKEGGVIHPLKLPDE